MLDFNKKYRSPEIHYFDGQFWLTLGREGGGTELLHFDGADLATSSFKRAVITEKGEDLSLFRDDDGMFYWVMGGGEIARMNAQPLAGLAAPPVKINVQVTGAAEGRTGQIVRDLHGAFLCKNQRQQYHLFVTGRLFRKGLGRTGICRKVSTMCLYFDKT